MKKSVSGRNGGAVRIVTQSGLRFADFPCQVLAVAVNGPCDSCKNCGDLDK